MHCQQARAAKDLWPRERLVNIRVWKLGGFLVEVASKTGHGYGVAGNNALTVVTMT